MSNPDNTRPICPCCGSKRFRNVGSVHEAGGPDFFRVVECMKCLNVYDWQPLPASPGENVTSEGSPPSRHESKQERNDDSLH